MEEGKLTEFARQINEQERKKKMENDTVANTISGFSLTTVIALILMVLKLCGKIGIAWKWIVLIWLSPIILVVAIILIYLVVLLIAFIIDRVKGN